MTTPLQTEPRRAARDPFRKPCRPPLEMPVLFQLADWSVQHVKIAPSSAAVTADPAAPIVEPPVANEPHQVEAQREGAPAVAAAAAESSMGKVPSAEPQPERATPQAVAEAPQTAASMDVEPRATARVPARDEKPAEGETKLTAAGQGSVTDVTPPKAAIAPTPRERAKQRARYGLPSPTKGDWMRTHGKYIVVAFVFALIATVYLAQDGDEPSPGNPGAASSTHAKAEAKTPSEREPKVTDAHAARESVPVAFHNHSPSLVDETSPVVGNPAAEARAELHAPGSGNPIKEPAQPPEIADSKSLFPWKAAGEMRVASKPEGLRAKPQAKAPAESRANELRLESNDEASAEQPALNEAPSTYGPPGSLQPEPAARQPASEGPELIDPNSYPVTDPTRYRDFELPQSRKTPVPPRLFSPGATLLCYQLCSQNIKPSIPNQRTLL